MEYKIFIILHDKENKTLTFENAVLEIGSSCILHTLYIKTPEPGVKRASGFLTPKLCLIYLVMVLNNHIFLF